MAGIPFAQHEHDSFQFKGGLDLVTPRFQVTPGAARQAQNFECDVEGGYVMSIGYERFDGQPKPSDASYYILAAAITGAFAVGNTLTGATSAATGKIISSATGYFVLTKVTGTFVAGENLNVGGPTIAVCSAGAVISGASTAKLSAQYTNLAADVYRADITTVPGSGSVLGVWEYNGSKYAFRNNAGGTACVMFKSSVAGWVAVTLTKEISFTAGGGNIADGQVLTKGAVTATIQRVVVQTGTLGAGTAAGRLIITTVVGGPFTAGAATTSGGGTLTLSGAETQITLLPSGRFEFDNVNFGGSTSTKRMYGCDGANRMFEFDGTVFVPIVTGMSPDTPKYLRGHKNHLFAAFKSSAQHSGIGLPYQWTAVTGAAELALGDDITGFMPQPGAQDTGAMAITTRNKIAILYGTSSTTWNLVTYQEEVGAFNYTVQHVGFTLMLDDRGITTLATSQAFGNFAHGSISNRIKPLLNEKKTRAIASMVVREKDQYRLFFNDKTGVYATFKGDKMLGIMPILLAHTMTCCCSREVQDGTEEIFFGTDDGYVMQMERGTSHDGDEIAYRLDAQFNASKSLRQLKRYRAAILDVSGPGYCEFSTSYDMAWANANVPQGDSQTLTRESLPDAWDTGSWDVGFWDGETLTPSEMELSGTAENISIKFSAQSDYISPLKLSGVIYRFTQRRSLR